VTKTVASYRARDWVDSEAAHELARAIMPTVDFESLGNGILEFPCVIESDDGPCEVMAFAFVGDDGPELRIQLRSENAVEKTHAS